MAGVRRTLGRPWSLAAALRRLSAPTSNSRTATAALFKEWEAFRDTPFEYRKGESWDRLLHQGVHLLEKFVREDRVRIPHPKENLQLKITRTLEGGNEFVSYIDAIGELDGKRLPDRLEDDDQPLFGRAGRASVSRSTADLLFLDQRHLRMWPSSCSSENSCPRSNT